MKSSIKMAGNLIISGVIGAAIGLLNAPKRGRKSRKLLSNGRSGLAEDLKNKQNDGISSMVNIAKNTVEKI